MRRWLLAVLASVVCAVSGWSAVVAVSAPRSVDTVAIASRAFDELAEHVRRGADAVCTEDPSSGLALVSPSRDPALDGARARLLRLGAYGLDVGSVYEDSLAASQLLASTHAAGRSPYATLPSLAELEGTRLVELTAPEGPPFAVLHACTTSGGLLVLAGRGLDLRSDPRFVGIRRVQRGGVTVPSLGLQLASNETPASHRGPALRVALGALAVLVLAVLASRSPTTSTEAPLAIEREVREATRRLSRGDFDTVFREGASSTQSAFQSMAEELKRARARAVKAERIAAWRDIARRIAHEIKNPLTPIRMAIETMRKTYARQHPDFGEIFDESTKTVLEEVARMERIVTEFSRFARMPRPNASRIQPIEVATQVVQLHEVSGRGATLPESRVKLEIAPELGTSPRLVRADREQLTQVLVNLLQNAIDAAIDARGASEAQVLVVLRPADLEAIAIEVHDNGEGVPEADRARIFEPYMTTKAHGTGLGLPICDRIVSDHGGTLTVDASRRLGGAVFTVVLSREGPLDEADASQTT